MKKVLVVVDMQNDFVTGVLGTPEARSLVDSMVQFVDGFDGEVIFTQDTHFENYLETQEGKRLPVEHCIIDTDGWQIIPELKSLAEIKFKKATFGSIMLGEDLYKRNPDEIHFVGVCTGICVIANAIMAKSFCPEARIVIHKDLCADVTPEAHELALKSLDALQMDIE